MRANGSEGHMKRCIEMESKLVEYLDGRARPAERRAVEQHLAGCPACTARAEDFRSLWGALDDLPAISPSPSFDASLRARIASEPAPRSFWSWLPAPRLAFATAALVAMSVWMASMPRTVNNETAMSRLPAEADFSMIRDLPVLENYDVVSKFDALSELPDMPNAATGEVKTETR